MFSYLDLKQKFIENKQRIMFASGSIIIFLLGFGTGRGYTEVSKTLPTPSNNSNYAIKTSPAPAQNKAPTSNKATDKQKSNTNQNCPVKGNISGKNKIYHVKGGAFYDKVDAEECFNTEDEAKAAGFRKSTR